jgi:DNA repair protein RecO
LDLFCHDEIFLRGTPRRNTGQGHLPPSKEKPYLVELTVLNSFIGLRDSLERMTTAGKLVQWVLKLADAATPMPGVYSLLGQSLSLVEAENDADRLELLALLFKLKLLSQLGLKPRVEACVRCADECREETYFDIESGGALCPKCIGSSSLLNRRALPPHEKLFLNRADEVRLTAWPQLQLPLDTIRQLSRLTTQFASFHANARLPL